MSDEQNPVVTQDSDEAAMQAAAFEALKVRANTLGVTFHPSISEPKLREKIAAKLSGEAAPGPEGPEMQAVATEETRAQRRQRLRMEANRLIRVRVACMNPAKSEREGEIFTVGNGTVGSFTKYVPFNNEEGWHVPEIILKQIQQRECQIFVAARDDKGNVTRKGKRIKEFAVEILPDLTVEELQELARRQAARNAVPN